MSDAPQPFFDFLQELRRRGVPVSVAHHQDVAQLCTRLGAWPGCDAQAMARSLAALLGRTESEVRDIEEAFFQQYAAAYFFADNAAPLPHGVQQAALGAEIERAQRVPQRRWRRWVGAAVLGALLAVLGYGYQHQHKKSTDLTSTGAPESEPPSQQPPREPTAQPPEPKPIKPEKKDPDLPKTPLAKPWRRVQLIVPLPLLVLLGLYGWRRRQELRSWARRHWREVRGSLDGPTDFTLKFLDLKDPLPRQDLEDMATVLGRGKEQHGPGRLNVPRSVHKTIERASLPTLAFDQRGTGRPLLVLCDVSADMHAWERKAQALVQGLMRRGVRLDVWYFDGDAARIAKEPFGRSMPLLQLYRQNPDAALLIISTGSRLLDNEEERRRAGKLAPWVEQLRRFRLRAWLHPVTDPSRWRPALQHTTFARQYLRVVPMCRAGMLAAAYELAQEADRRVHITQAAMQPTRRVRPLDVQRMQRLMALYPGAPLELVELLRQKFWPQIPDDVVLDLLSRSETNGGRTLSFSDGDLARLLVELQNEDAALAPAERQEDLVRRYLIKLLNDSEPADPTCLGHMKWRLRKAMQQIYLHDPDNRSVNEAVATLRELVRGPLWEETHGELWALGVPGNPYPHGVPARPMAAPVAERLEQEVLTLVKQTAGGKVAQPGGAAPVADRPSRLGWRRFGELGPALAVAGVVAAIVVWQKLGTEPPKHENGYELAWNAVNPEGSEIELQVVAKTGGFPEAVIVCQDDDCQAANDRVELQDGKGSSRRKRDKEDHYFHVQAGQKQHLVYSEAVLVPGYEVKHGVIRVQLISAATKQSLPQGEYEVEDSRGFTLHTASDLPLSVIAGPVQIRGRAPGYHEKIEKMIVRPRIIENEVLALTPDAPQLIKAESLDGVMLPQRVKPRSAEKTASVETPVPAAAPIAKIELGNVNLSLSAPAQIHMGAKAVDYHALDKNIVSEEIQKLQAQVELQEVQNGPVHRGVATALFELGRAYYSELNYQLAEQQYKRALAIEEKLMRSESVSVSKIYLNLGHVYTGQGKSDLATSAYEKALEIAEKNQDTQGILVAINLFYLARNYENQKKHIKANLTYDRALVFFKKNKAEFTGNLGMLKALATHYEQQNQNETAELLYKRVLAGQENINDVAHVDVIDAMSSLTQFYIRQKSDEKAFQLLERMLAVAANEKGYVGAYATNIFIEIAGLYERRGQTTRAEQLCKRMLETFERKKGPDSLSVALVLDELAGIYKTQEDYTHAELNYARALAIREKNKDAKKLTLVDSLANLAHVYDALGRHALAETLYMRALAIIDLEASTDILDVTLFLKKFAKFYIGQKQYDQAEPLLRRMLANFEKKDKYCDYLVFDWLSDLASLYVDKEQYDQADNLYGRMLTILEKRDEKDKASVAKILVRRAKLYADQGKDEQAESLYTRAIKIQEKHLKGNPSALAETLEGLAAFYEAHGQPGLAPPLRDSALKLKAKSPAQNSQLPPKE